MTTTDRTEIKVIFRKWRNGGILALFPESPADIYGNYCDSYEHVGQHGGAYYWACIQTTSPATVEEAKDLIEELTRIGYDLEIVQRATRSMHDKRLALARRNKSSIII